MSERDRANLWNSFFFTKFSNFCRLQYDKWNWIIIIDWWRERLRVVKSNWNIEFDWILIDMLFVMSVYFTNIYVKYGQQPSFCGIKLHAFPLVVNTISHSSYHTHPSHIEINRHSDVLCFALFSTAKEKNSRILCKFFCLFFFSSLAFFSCILYFR